MDFIRRTDSSLVLQERIAKEKEELLENVKREVLFIVCCAEIFARWFAGNNSWNLHDLGLFSFAINMILFVQVMQMK